VLALFALGMAGAAACNAVAPSPSIPGSRPPTFASAPNPVGSAGSTPAGPSPRATPTRGGLGAELDIRSFPRDVSGTTLEFVSDGWGILYSSSRAPDSGPEAAPDLWRYEPGADEPVLVWRNPQRDHSIVKIAGFNGTAAFVDIPITGERAWDLWLVPRTGAEAIRLDRHPGDEDVPSLVPSLAVWGDRVAWTASDRGQDGPVSQLLLAEAPAWEPRVLLERRSAEAELWLPSLFDTQLVYTEVVYAPDRQTDERRVFYLDLADPGAEPRRLDTSGRATMPLVLGNTVLWKEADPGMNMFNWGRMFRYDLATGGVAPLSVAPQEQVNYPSIGERYVAWWGINAFEFGIYDLELSRPGFIESYSEASQDNVLRPHLSGSLLVWLFANFSDMSAPVSELRYAFLPDPGTGRGDR
jgi:hypothetical protein